MMNERVGIVVIGRNEGARLHTCLKSVASQPSAAVYVDSGSIDGSPEIARALGFHVVELDASRPFSAGRARNEGFDRLMEIAPNLTFVQFMDGDCELLSGWLARGAAELVKRSDVALASGAVCERYPEASIYNRLCAIEWRVLGEGERNHGGNMMIRSEAFRGVGGFRPQVIAAEDDDLCVRLKQRGWKLTKLSVSMVTHDAAMITFGPWWRRAIRSGHAVGQGAALHGSPSFVRDCRRIWSWGILLPVTSLALALAVGAVGFIMLGAYPLQMLRIYWRQRSSGSSRGDSMLYAVFTVLAKFPAALGLVQYYLRCWRGQPLTIIEHKVMGGQK